MSRTLLGVALVLSLLTTPHDARTVPAPPSAALIASMDACGDSITKGFNAQSSFPCPNSDQELFNYATSDTSGADACAPGPEGVVSHAERIKCLRGASIFSATPNSAESGAQMLTDFEGQANSVHARLMTQPPPRYIPILLGFSDVCGGKLFKFNLSCSRGSDQDRNNYCRTTAGAFEREFRKGLDVLMSIPETHIGVAALPRGSQLCNHPGKRNCQTFTTCRDFWTAAAYLGWLFGHSGGLCGSLTTSCSDTRIADAYRTLKTYRDIMMRVVDEYANVLPGEASPVVLVGGQTVGGGIKAPGVTIAYSDAPWRYRIRSSDVSCCDCYHPSAAGQNALSAMLFEGLTCTPERPCCADTGDALTNGRCAVVITDGTTFPGLFGSAADDGNLLPTP